MERKQKKKKQEETWVTKKGEKMPPSKTTGGEDRDILTKPKKNTMWGAKIPTWKNSRKGKRSYCELQRTAVGCGGKYQQVHGKEIICTSLPGQMRAPN